jgi:hypothetical protein
VNVPTALAAIFVAAMGFGLLAYVSSLPETRGEKMRKCNLMCPYDTVPDLEGEDCHCLPEHSK